ncbi:MAG: toll/interleukin-1 receptor domain-containing protein [Acidobacteriia bacterium]|nr:toll/interleukin-1 receptor domain-containing protein [Terriglobia bacterium]
MSVESQQTRKEVARVGVFRTVNFSEPTVKYDVFISYAIENEEALVSPLASTLTKLGLRVWFAPAVLKVGDSLSRAIDKGLAGCRFGVIVLSKAFIAKPWPRHELRGLISKAVGKRKVILPIWHHISRHEVLKFSPPLADAYALVTRRLDVNQSHSRLLKLCARIFTPTYFAFKCGNG